MIEMVMETFNFLSQMSVEKMRMRLLCLFPKEVKIPQRGDYLCCKNKELCPRMVLVAMKNSSTHATQASQRRLSGCF